MGAASGSGIVLVAGLDAVADPKGRSGQGGRMREVWTNDDFRLFERVAKVVKVKGDTLLLRCGNELCADRAIKLVSDAAAPRGAVLRCGCTDRHFLRSA